MAPVKEPLPFAEETISAIRTQMVMPAIAAWQAEIPIKKSKASLAPVEIEKAAARAADVLSSNFKRLFTLDDSPFDYAKSTLIRVVIPEVWKVFYSEGKGVLVGYSEAEKNPYLGNTTPLAERSIVSEPTSMDVTKIVGRHCSFHRFVESSTKDYIVKSVSSKVVDTDSDDYIAEEVVRNYQKVRWNQDMYDRCKALARQWVLGIGLDSSEKIAVCQITAGICFFTGRRPWSEIASISTLSVGESAEGVPPEDDWADGWLTITGLAKKSDKQRSKKKDILTLPICDITAEELVDAHFDLHDRLSTFEWFDIRHEKIQNIVHTNLCETGIDKVMEVYFRPIFNKVITDYNSDYLKMVFRLFRQLYASHIYYVRQSAIESDTYTYIDIYKLADMDQKVFAKMYLSHEDMKTSALYDFWVFKP